MLTEKKMRLEDGTFYWQAHRGTRGGGMEWFSDPIVLISRFGTLPSQ